MKKNTSIFILCLLLAKTLEGQTVTPEKKFPNIVLQGETMDSAFLGSSKNTQDLKLHIPTIASVFTEAPTDIYDYELGAQKKFKHVIQPKSKFTYINFSTQKNGGKPKWSDIDNMYILGAGDKIYCRLSTENQYLFSGKGAEKLNCQSEIYSLRYMPNQFEGNLLKKKDYSTYYYLRSKKKDSLLENQLKVLDNYSNMLGNEMTDIMLINCYGLRYYSEFRQQIMFSTILPAAFKKFALNKTFKNINLKLPKTLSDESLVDAPIYANAVLMKIIIDNLLDDSNQIRKLRSKEVINGVYADITTNYQGILRQKLLLLFFYEFKNSMFMVEHLNNALKYFNKTEYRSAFLEFQSIKTKDSPFYPFDLEDDKGKKVKLTDLGKNIIILDFWYTGCRNCIILRNGMTPVYEKYKNDPRVKFVSINIDKSKVTWKHSISEGSYTHPNQINLHTGGVGYNHPVIKKNQINGYPALFILKNGKIYSANPPRPHPKNEESTKAFVSLIEEAVAEKSSKQSK